MRLDDYGLHVNDMIAGFAGGVVHAFAFKQTEPWAVIGSVVMGTLVANYVGPEFAHFMKLDDIGAGSAAFLSGLSAMAIIQGGIGAIQARLKSFGGEKTDGGKS